MTVHPITLQPPIREAEPYVTARVQGTTDLLIAPTFTVDVPLDPAYADPQHPPRYPVEVDAPFEQGFFRALYIDDDGQRSYLSQWSASPATEPLVNWRPPLTDVAQLRRDRLVGKGVRHATFTSDTDPTDTEAQGLVDDAVALINAVVGPDIKPELWSLARRAAALQAAMLIQPGGREVDVERERALQDRYDALFTQLTSATVTPVRPWIF